MPVTGLAIPTLLLLFAVARLFAGRSEKPPSVRSLLAAPGRVPTALWLIAGMVAYTIPVFEYWTTGLSHGNGLAGFLPWADATEYYQCSQTYLLGIDGPNHCGKRPYYFAFFADLLWLSGNDLQFALLLQALIAGVAATLLSIHVVRTLGWAAAVGTYATLYAFAAALCTSLVMTENAGLILGILAVMVLLRNSEDNQIALFLSGVAVFAAAMSARPGPLFVLPALGLWYLCYGKGLLRERFVVALAAGIVSALAMTFIATPILIAGGTLGSTHSNFSYSLYGLVVGGKGWLQVSIDHPEIFEKTAVSQTDKVYALAFESLREHPHLAVLGYLKGLAKYFDDLFRYTTGFKPLRLLLLLVPWCLGVYHALRNWKKPRESLLLFMLAGIILSSPLLIYDAHNRGFASTEVVNALFVAMGLQWIGVRLSLNLADHAAGASTAPLPLFSGGHLAIAALAALALPVAMLAAIRPGQPEANYAAPDCPGSTRAVVVRPQAGTPVLQLVEQGQESVFPLRLRADHFASRFHRTVHKKQELTLPAGSKLFWGIRLDEDSPGQSMYFNWPGKLPPAGRAAGFCVRFVSRARIGTAISIEPNVRRVSDASKNLEK